MIDDLFIERRAPAKPPKLSSAVDVIIQHITDDVMARVAEMVEAAVVLELARRDRRP